MLIKGFVGISQLRVQCIIGDLPEEREKEQELYIDIEVEGNSSEWYLDSLQHTIDYTQIANMVRNISCQRKFRMIEALAHAIAISLQRQFSLSTITVKIHKPGAIPGAANAYVKLIFKQEKSS